MKDCFKCGETKHLADFYKHPNMPDGHVNKCKECNKADVRKNRADRIEYYREYDRKRGSRQDQEYRERYRLAFPKKYRAQSMVGNAVRDGKLFREPCYVCGREDTVHAHHDDYSRPLNVRWLCAAHHKQWHQENGEGLNGI